MMVMCGMAAAFSALCGTPITAAVFAMEVVSVGVMYYAALVPCTVSALTAFQVAQLKTIARPIQARFDLLAESESLPVPTVLRTHRDDATAVAKHLLGDEEQAEGASRVAHRVTSMKED